MTQGNTQILAVASGKGGVGKTTTVVNLGESLAKLGQRVLLADLDPQNGLLLGLGLEEMQQEPGLLQLLAHGGTLGDHVLGLDTDGLDVLLAGYLDDLEPLHRRLVERPAALAELMSAVEGHYDYVLLDCPAGFSGTTPAALVAAHRAMVPVQCHPLALRTLPTTLRQLLLSRERQNGQLTLGGLLLTMYDPALEAKEHVAEQVWNNFPEDAVYRTVIPLSDHLVDQFRVGNPVAYAQPRTAAAQAYLQLAREVLEKQGGGN